MGERDFLKRSWDKFGMSCFRKYLSGVCFAPAQRAQDAGGSKLLSNS